jgi:hypothetical protein
MVRSLVVAKLPDDWRVSRVDVRGVAYQYCVTTPDAGWFRIRVGAVTAYGDSGSCHLDPDMQPEF